MDPDQTALLGAIWSGIIVFASMIQIVWCIWIYAANVKKQTLFSWQNKKYINRKKVKIECNSHDFQCLYCIIHLCHMEASNFNVKCHILQPYILDACHFVSGVSSNFSTPWLVLNKCFVISSLHCNFTTHFLEVQHCNHFLNVYLLCSSCCRFFLLWWRLHFVSFWQYPGKCF